MIEDISTSTKVLSHLAILKLLMTMFMICHWLACFMAWSSDGCVDSCDGPDARTSSWWQYVASLYWALTTVTTVGYGDISPSTTSSRLFAIAAMVIGGAFYGFVVGSITHVVTTWSMNERLYFERMSEVQAWLDFHRFPPALHRRVRMYFANQLRHRPPPDEDHILSHLPPELQSTLSDLIVSREVRMNPLLKGLPANVLSRLSRCIQRITVEPGEQVVAYGELGYAMFVVTEGELKKQSPKEGQPVICLELGDSFGEEVLSGVESRYKYNVHACKRCCLQAVPLVGLTRELPHTPTLMDLLRRNYHYLAKASSRRLESGFEVESGRALRKMQQSLEASRARQEEMAGALDTLAGRLDTRQS